MWFGIDPMTIGVGTLVWLAFRKQTNSNHGVLTPEREEIFVNAMQHCQDPGVLNSLAQKYHNEGLKPQAYLLRKRAEWRGRSKEKRDEHDAIFDKAMQSQNIQGVLAVASAFEQMTATQKAELLRQHATRLNEAALKAEADKRTAEPAKAPAAEPAKQAAEPAKPADQPKAEGGIPENTSGNTQVIR